MPKILRLLLGDQLNSHHSWFKTIDDNVVYVLMEIRSETDYASHHIQKIVGFFAAMRDFAETLQSNGHRVIYFKLLDDKNLQTFDKNLENLTHQHQITHFEYQLPDEYRLDQQLKNFCATLSIPHSAVDSEHFYTTRNELKDFFEGKKTYLMESFYRAMRKKHQVLMNGDNPMNSQWNFDGDNRKKLPKNHKPIAPLVFDNDVSDIQNEIATTDIKTIGTIDAFILFGLSTERNP